MNPAEKAALAAYLDELQTSGRINRDVAEKIRTLAEIGDDE